MWELINDQILSGRYYRCHPVCTAPSTRPERWIEGREGAEGEENRVALKEQQKIPRKRRNEIGNADYIHKRMTE